MAFGDSLLRIARTTGDRTLAAAVHVWRGRKFANDSRLPEGQPDLDTAWALASALRDSAGLARVLTARAHGLSVLGRHDAAYPYYRRLVRTASAAGLPGLVGFAHRGMGMADKMAGRYDEASRHLREALRLIPPERFENRHSRFLLAEVANRVGRHDEARGMFLAVLDEARQRKDRWLQAAAFNDLGNLEYEGGDMAMADRYWEFAAGVFDSTSDPASALNTRINRAHALRNLGRVDESRALLDRLIEDASRLGNQEPLIGAYGELANLYRRMGRSAQAEGLYRRVRAEATEDAEAQEAASIDLAGLLRETGRPRAAEVLIDSLLVPERRARLTRDNLAAAWCEQSAARRAQGRAREALAVARAAERQSRSDRQAASAYWLDTAIELARCHRDLGAPDSAVVVLRRAANGWERWRSAISDLEWRERSGSGLASLFTEYGLALLDERRGLTPARRAREAFDALQAFQARTLEERMHGAGLAGQAMRHRVTADSLRRGVLRDGELLVDVVATPDTSFAFLLSRAGLEARMLPGADRLERLHADWREATLSGAETAVVQAGLRRLSTELLAPLSAPIRGSRRVIWTGGGPLALWPLGALTLPGEASPLCETRELFTAPSATLLASLRARERAAPRAAGRLLALGRTTDASGRNLPGAERELRSLGSEFAGVEVRVNRGERAVSELTADLSRWNVLHFAAHAEAESGSPWRAGFLLGRGSGDDAYLRASGVTGMRLRAQLAVLSGCQSAGAATLAGEGALGLASAFLCSGTSSVVATLWPVEDRVAQRFMVEFYDALAAGRTVAGAVGEAQSSLRSHADTAGTRDWAAFVAAGEAATRVRLTRRGATGDREP
jgi:CHAT domain-containing protein/tetratricopeptide (TPR) repeat protein